MIVRRVLGAVAVSGALPTALLLGASGTALAQDSANLTASGSGAEEIPSGSGEAGTSITGSFQVTSAGSLTYTVSITGNKEKITAGHIHKGAAGANGAVVVPLDAAAINAGTTATTQIDPTLAADIIAGPKNFYLNTHSPSFKPPTGNARAQLAATSASPSTIDTGTGGQAAAAAQGSSATTYALGGVLVIAAAGGAVAVARRRGDTHA